MTESLMMAFDTFGRALALPPSHPERTVHAIQRQGNVLIVDVRDAPELASGGKLKGAVNVSRGMLEFRADPESSSHNPEFQPDRTVLIYCGSGGRAALSGKALKDLGYQSVYNAGGFKELADAGLDTEPA